MLRRITNLFLENAADFKEQQIGVFDDVLCQLVGKIERDAIAELSRDIAPHLKAPPSLTRQLSQHEDIEVSGPVLQRSPLLSDGDLIELAQRRSQLHLAAIASRSRVSESVSDVLIERGNSAVLTTIARNFGARFSSRGYTTLVGKAGQDGEIASALIARPDLSPDMFRQLIAQATATVQQRLLASADAPTRDRLNAVLTNISAQMTQDVDRQASARAARPGPQINALNKGKLRAELLDYATARRFAESVTALATLSALPAETIKRLLNQQEYDAILLVCKASGLGWLTVRAILELAADGNRAADLNPAIYFARYAALSDESAQRVMRFLKVHKIASASDLKKALAS
jgi:uncharacterized protein (DUF2336 family)